MNLYHKSILYGPDQEGSGGSGKNTTQSELSAQELSTLISDSTETRDGEDSSLQEGERVDTEFDLDTLPDLSTDTGGVEIEGSKLDELASVKEEIGDIELPALDDIEDQYPFPRDSETGLSSQLIKIEDLGAQLQSLEDGNPGYEVIKSTIEANRVQEKIEFESFLLKNKSELRRIYTELYTKGKGAGSFTGTPEQMLIINVYLDALKKNSQYSEIGTKIEDTINQIQSKIETLTTDLGKFEKETESQIAEAIQDKKEGLNTELSQAKQEYSVSEAKVFDTKILLERQLEGQLTDPNMLFSRDNINQIFAIYGLEEGLNRLQNLRDESNEAREKASRDKIRGDIFSHTDRYHNNPELTQVLSTDIQLKLETLQQAHPESKTVQRALSLEGTDKLDYLTNSEDSELNDLAFWFSEDRNANIDTILAEHSNFTQYVNREIDERYESKQQDIRDGRVDGRVYLGSKMDQELQQEIDARIANQLSDARGNKLQTLQQELYALQYDEQGATYDAKDKAILGEQERLNTTDIEKFKLDLKQAIDSGQIKFEKGSFIQAENISEKQGEINGRLQKLFDEIDPLLKVAGYALQSLEGLSNIQNQIEKDKEKQKGRPFGLGNKSAEALGKLADEVAKVLQRYNELQTTKQSNASQFESNKKTIGTLESSYQKLPKSIQDSLASIENPSFDSITTTIDTGVNSIQSYETPADIVQKREQITDLESQVVSTQAINISQPTT